MGGTCDSVRVVWITSESRWVECDCVRVDIALMVVACECVMVVRVCGWGLKLWVM